MKNLHVPTLVFDPELANIDGLISSISLSVQKDCSVSIPSKNIREHLYKKRKEHVYYQVVLQKGFEDLYEKLDSGADPRMVVNIFINLIKITAILHYDVDLISIVKKFHDCGYMIDDRQELLSIQKRYEELFKEYMTSKDSNCQKQLARCVLTKFILSILQSDADDILQSSMISDAEEFVRMA